MIQQRKTKYSLSRLEQSLGKKKAHHLCFSNLNAATSPAKFQAQMHGGGATLILTHTFCSPDQ